MEIEFLQVVANWGGTGLLLVLLAFGRVLPKSWVDRLLKNKDDQIIALQKQNDVLMQFQEPVLKLVQTLNEQAEQKEVG